MRRCSSAPTPSKRAGKRCSRSSMPGRTIRRADFPNYAAGSGGPAAADELLGARWSRVAAAATERRRRVTMATKRKISLVLADVDGTLVTEDKVLTQRAHRRRAGVARSRNPLCHHQRPAAARHGHAVRCARASTRRSPASTAGCSSSAILRSSSEKTVPADVARAGDRPYSPSRPRRLGLSRQ